MDPQPAAANCSVGVVISVSSKKLKKLPFSGINAEILPCNIHYLRGSVQHVYGSAAFQKTIAPRASGPLVERKISQVPGEPFLYWLIYSK